jgi:orotate phosphoribosyltransferase-like protein
VTRQRVRELLAKGKTGAEIARELGLSKSTALLAVGAVPFRPEEARVLPMVGTVRSAGSPAV